MRLLNRVLLNFAASEETIRYVPANRPVRFGKSYPTFSQRPSNPFQEHLPLTKTGEHPSPRRASSALCRVSSSLNQLAHSGTAGKPNRCASRHRTNSGSRSHSTVRFP